MHYKDIVPFPVEWISSLFTIRSPYLFEPILIPCFCFFIFISLLYFLSSIPEWFETQFFGLENVFWFKKCFLVIKCCPVMTNENVVIASAHHLLGSQWPQIEEGEERSLVPSSSAIMEAEGFSETLLLFYETARRNLTDTVGSCKMEEVSQHDTSYTVYA